MKRNIILTLSLCVTLLLYSCGGGSSQGESFLKKRLSGYTECAEESEYDYSRTDTIKVYDSIIDRMTHSSLVDKVRYVVPEKTGESIFSTVMDIKYNDKYFFIKDKDERLRQFDIHTGEYIGSVFSRGEGPEEVMRMHDFEVDQDYVYVLDGRRVKMTVYDMNGKFVKSKDLPFRAMCVRKKDDNTFVFNLATFNEHYPSIDNYKVAVTDSTFQPKSKYIYKDEKENSHRMGKTPYFTPVAGEFGFTAVYGDVYYDLDEDNKYYPRYYFDLGKRAVPIELVEGDTKVFYNTLKDENKAVMYQTPIHGRKYMLMDIGTASVDNKGLFVYNREDKKSFFVRGFKGGDRSDMIAMPRIIAYNLTTDEYIGVLNVIDLHYMSEEDKNKLKNTLDKGLYSILMGEDESDIVVAFLKLK